MPIARSVEEGRDRRMGGPCQGVEFPWDGIPVIGILVNGMPRTMLRNGREGTADWPYLVQGTIEPPIHLVKGLGPGCLLVRYSDG